MFKNVWRWITGIFQDAAKALEKPAETVNKIVNVIKEYVYNPAVDLITLLTRTGVDDAIVAKIREMFPGIMAGLLKAENIIHDVAAGNLNSLMLAFAKYIQNLGADARGKWWVELAAVLLPLIAGQNVQKPLAITVTQATYLKNAA